MWYVCVCIYIHTCSVTILIIIKINYLTLFVHLHTHLVKKVCYIFIFCVYMYVLVVIFFIKWCCCLLICQYYIISKFDTFIYCGDIPTADSRQVYVVSQHALLPVPWVNSHQPMFPCPNKTNKYMHVDNCLVCLWPQQLCCLLHCRQFTDLLL